MTGQTKTVGELMDMLRKLKPEARVWVHDGEWGPLALRDIYNVEKRHSPFLGCDIKTGKRVADVTDLDVIIETGIT